MVDQLEKFKVIPGLILKAVGFNSDTLEIEYKDGYEEIFAFKGRAGFRVESLKFNESEATQLRQELYELAKRKKSKLNDMDYFVTVKIYESFGEDAFQVKIEKVAVINS